MGASVVWGFVGFTMFTKVYLQRLILPVEQRLVECRRSFSEQTHNIFGSLRNCERGVFFELVSSFAISNTKRAFQVEYPNIDGGSEIG